MGWGQRGKADRGEGRAESPGREGLRQLKVASAGRPRLEEDPLSCCISLNGRNGGVVNVALALAVTKAAKNRDGSLALGMVREMRTEDRDRGGLWPCRIVAAIGRGHGRALRRDRAEVPFSPHLQSGPELENQTPVYYQEPTAAKNLSS